MNTTQIAEGIVTTIRAMNRSWTEGWHEELFRQYIHPDAVAIVPATPGRLEGRDAYVAGWRGFAEAAVIHEWMETGHKVPDLCRREKCRSHVSLLDNVCHGHGEADHAGTGHVLSCERGTELAGCCRPVFPGTFPGRVCWIVTRPCQFLPIKW